MQLISDMGDGISDLRKGLHYSVKSEIPNPESGSGIRKMSNVEFRRELLLSSRVLRGVHYLGSLPVRGDVIPQIIFSIQIDPGGI